MPMTFSKAVGVCILLFSAFFSGCEGEVGATSEEDETSPQVALVSPKPDTVYSSAQVVVLEASASDNVAVTSVEFFDGDVRKGTVSAPPYRLSWALNESDNGIHTLTARAWDAAGNEATSEPIDVTVELPVADTEPPTVALKSPASAQNITTAQTLELEATVSDNVGVARVEFHDGASLLGTVTESPYTFSWALGSRLNGVHSVTAKAFDAAENVATSTPVEISVNVPDTDTTPPTVALTAPAAGASYTSAQAVTLTASANDDVGVTRVEFFHGTTRIGNPDTTAPYSVVWNVTAAHNGSRALTAKAYDAASNSTTSMVVSVTVNISDTVLPTVALTAPAAGASYTSAQNVTVSATASDNVAVTRVEFYDGTTRIGNPDTTSPYSVTWAVSSAQNGSRTLTARAYDAAGNVRTSVARTVTVNIGGTGTAKTYYVSTSGSDSNNGSSNTPFKTIAYAVSKMVPGDTTYVQGGVYNEKLIRFSRSGTESAPIRLLNAPGQSPVIDFGQDPSIYNFTDIRRILFQNAAGASQPIGWIVLEGFEIRNGYEGVKFYNLHNSIIRRNWIHHNRNQGILGGPGHHNLFDRNRINHNGPIVNCVGKCNLEHGMYVAGQQYVITNNLIYDNLAFGIQVNGSSAPSSDWLIANNTFAYNRNRAAIVLWGSPKNIRVENNIFYENCNLHSICNNREQGLSISSGVRGATIKNNLFFASGSGGTLPYSSTATEGVQFTQSGNIVNTANPRFVSAGATIPGAPDFELQDGSPAIDKGLTLSDVPYDYRGLSRPEGGRYDIGAFEMN